MRTLFLGSPIFATTPLRQLVSRGCDVVGVVSQPSRAAGRGRTPTDPAVVVCARELGLNVLQPEKATDPAFIDAVRALEPELAVTAAYGQILSREFLAIPTRGTINIHPSLLPAYRGATPVQTALLNGDKTTGVTILFTVAKLDAGNIICQEQAAIGADESTSPLLDRLFALGAQLLHGTLEALADPNFVGTPQREDAVTKCHKIKKEDGLVNWTEPSATIHCRFRAYDPWPGLYTYLDGRRVVLTSVRIPGPMARSAVSGTPGRFATSRLDGIPVVEIVTGTGTLAVLSLKPEGGKDLKASDFWNGIGSRSSGQFSTTGCPVSGGGVGDNA